MSASSFQVCLMVGTSASSSQQAQDIIYANALSGHLKENTGLEIQKAEIYSEKLAFECLKSAKDQHMIPVLHLVLSAPYLENLDEKLLQIFQAQGGYIVLSIRNFAACSVEDKTRLLSLISIADDLHFVEELDKKSALLLAEAGMPQLQTKLKKAAILPSFPILQPAPLKVYENYYLPRDILALGLARQDQGLEYLLALATLIKSSSDPLIKDKKILLVERLQGSQALSEAELRKLLSAVYPDKQKELENKNIQEMVKSLEEYRSAVKERKLKVALPIELHFDLNDLALQEIIQKASYSYLPATLSHAHLSLSNEALIRSCLGACVTYSSVTASTPEFLLPGGKYQHALIPIPNLLSQDKKQQSELDRVQHSSSLYQQAATWVVDDILRREKDPRLNHATVQGLKNFVRKCLSLESILHQFQGWYCRLPKNRHPRFSNAFYSWQARVQARRAYKKFENVQEIDIPAQSKKNFKDLINRLKTLEGPYSKEMVEFLTQKRNQAVKPGKQKPGANWQGQVLTVEEMRVLGKILDAPWFLQHVTGHHKNILKKGGRLLSLDERARRKEKIDNAHTTVLEGNRDNVFLSMGMGRNYDTVNFLHDVDTVFVADYRSLQMNNSVNLKGSWSSGHMYAFLTEQEAHPIKIFGCQYSDGYQKGLDPKTGEDEWLKTCIFRHPDGQEYIQYLRKEDEIFVHPKIKLALGLMCIEKFRFFGKSAWQEIMRASDQSLQTVVQAIFHAGVFEVHKPAQFSLTEAGVDLVKRHPNGGSNEYSSEKRKLFEHALLGNEQEFSQLLREDFPINDWNIFGPYTINLLAAVALSGTFAHFKQLLEMNADINATGYQCLSYLDTFGKTESKASSLMFFIIMSSKPQLLQATLKRLLGDKYIDKFPDLDRKTNSETKLQTEDTQLEMRAVNRAYEFAKFLVQVGQKFKQDPNITKTYRVDAEAFNDIVLLLKPHPKLLELLIQGLAAKGEDLILANVLALEPCDLKAVEFLLKKGVEIGERTEDTWASANGKTLSLIAGIENRALTLAEKMCMTPGTFPLMMAVKLNNLELAKLLLQYKADVNQVFSVGAIERSDGYDLCIRITEEEGFTPLMFAVQQDNLALVKLLLASGANPIHRALNGRHAFDLAKEKQNPEVLKLLQSKIKPGDETLDLRSHWQKEAAHYAMHCHTAYNIVTGLNAQGKRFFILQGSNYFPFSNDSMQDDDPLNLDAIKGLNKLFDLKLASEDLRTRELAAFNCGVQGKPLHYADIFRVWEFSKQTGANFATKMEDLIDQINTSVDEESPPGFFIYEDEILEQYEKTRKSRFEFEHGKIKIPSIAAYLMHHIIKDPNAALPVELMSMLQKQYSEFRTCQVAVQIAVKENAVDKLKGLLADNRVSINYRHPILEARPYDDPILSRYYSSQESWLVTAIVHESVDATLVIIQAGAKAEIFPEAVLEKMFKINRPELYEAYVSFLKEQEAETGNTLLQEFVTAIYRHSALGCLNWALGRGVITKTPNEIVEVAAEYLAVDIVKSFLAKVSNPAILPISWANVSPVYCHEVDLANHYRLGYLFRQGQLQGRIRQFAELVFTLPGYKVDLWHFCVIAGKFISDQNFTLVHSLIPHLDWKKEEQNQNSLEFTCQFQGKYYLVKHLKTRPKEVLEFLAITLDKSGKLCPFVPLLNGLGRNFTLGFEFIQNWILPWYRNIAPNLVFFKIAIETGDVTQVQTLIQQGVDPNAFLLTPAKALKEQEWSLEQFSRPLVLAIQHKQLGVAQTLLALGADKALLNADLKLMLEKLELEKQKLELEKQKGTLVAFQARSQATQNPAGSVPAAPDLASQQNAGTMRPET